MAADNDFPNNLPDPQTPEGGASAELDPNRFDEMHRRILASLKAPDDDAAMDLPDFDMPDDTPEWAAAIEDMPEETSIDEPPAVEVAEIDTEPLAVMEAAPGDVEDDNANVPTLTDAETIPETVALSSSDETEAVAEVIENVPDESPTWAADETESVFAKSPETIEIPSPVEPTPTIRDTVEFTAVSDEDQPVVVDEPPLATMEFSALAHPEPFAETLVDARSDDEPEESPLADAELVATDDATDEGEPVAEVLDLELPGKDVSEAVAATESLADEPEPVAVAEPVEADDSLAHLVAEIDSETRRAAPVPSGVAVAETTETTAKARYIVFSAVGSRYAVPIEGVTEIGRVPKITSVPNLPEWVRGVTNLRGDVLSVVDFRTFFDLPSLEVTDSDRMMVVRAGRSGLVTGLIVDGVAGMRDLADTEIVPPSTLIEDKVADYLRGVCTRDDALLAVLDLEKFLSSSEIRQFESL